MKKQKQSMSTGNQCLFMSENSLEKHQIIIDNFIECFREIMPNASLAISGSIASNNYNSESDIDFVCFSSQFNKIRRFVSYLDGIRTNVICFNADLLDYTQLGQILLVEYDPSIVHYILSSIPLIGYEEVTNTKNRLKTLIKQRKTLKYQLIQIVNSNIEKLLNVIQQDDIDELNKRKTYIESIDFFIRKWFLQNDIYLFDVRKEYLNKFEFIKRKDIGFHKLLISCFPININKLNDLEKIDSYLNI